MICTVNAVCLYLDSYSVCLCFCLCVCVLLCVLLCVVVWYVCFCVFVFLCFCVCVCIKVLQSFYTRQPNSTRLQDDVLFNAATRAAENATRACSQLATFRYEIASFDHGIQFYPTMNAYQRLQVQEVTTTTATAATPEPGDVLLTVDGVDVFNDEDLLKEMKKDFVAGANYTRPKILVFGRKATNDINDTETENVTSPTTEQVSAESLVPMFSVCVVHFYQCFLFVLHISTC